MSRTPVTIGASADAAPRRPPGVLAERPEPLPRVRAPHHARSGARPAVPRAPRDPQAELLAEKGAEHERAWLERFKAEGRAVVSIEAAGGERDWLADARRTRDAMREGAEVIYQGVFVDGDWHGISDFLVRVDTPSELGAWSYEAWDTKLARTAEAVLRPAALLLHRAVARIQGNDTGPDAHRPRHGRARARCATATSMRTTARCAQRFCRCGQATASPPTLPGGALQPL